MNIKFILSEITTLFKKIIKEYKLVNKYHQESSPDSGQQEVNSSQKLIRITAVAFLVLLVWAGFSKIDQTTRAQGQIIPSSRSQIIQSYDGGVLQELLVKEGDHVEKDQILAKLDQTRMLTTYLEAKAKAAALSGNVSRLTAEVYGTPLKFDELLNEYKEFQSNQRILFNKRTKAINEEISALKEQLDLTVSELNMTQPLLITGDVSKVEVLRLQKQVTDVQAQIANKKNKYLQDAQAELNKSQEELAGVMQQVAQKKEQLDRVELRSPMSGTVKNVKITTLGGVIKPGEEVMQIVPSGDDLIIEAKVKPSEIAFIKPGLDVIVKIDAYDYSIYGSLHGKLTYISADTLVEENRTQAGGDQTYYRVQIKTDGKKFSSKKSENLEIEPGMTATVEIITGSHTVLSYLTKPITKTITSSMNER